jgi:hypothetical protein
MFDLFYYIKASNEFDEENAIKLYILFFRLKKKEKVI